MPWILYAEDPRPNYLAWIHRIRHFALGWQSILPQTFDTAIVTIDGHTEYYLEQEGFRNRGASLLSLIYERPDWFQSLQWKANVFAEKLIRHATRIHRKNYDKIRDEVLNELASHFLTTYHRAQDHGVLMSALEFDHELFTKYLLDYLNQFKRGTKNASNTSAMFSTLTTSTRNTYAKQYKISELGILTLVYANSALRSTFEDKQPFDIVNSLPAIDRDLFVRIEAHYKAFCWLPYGSNGPAWTKEEVIRSLQVSLQSKKAPRKRLNELLDESAKISKKQQSLCRSLGIDERNKHLFQIAQDAVYLKGLRKDATSYGFYCAENLFRQMAKRMGIALSQLRMLFPRELVDAFRTGQSNINQLNSRIEASVYLIEGGQERLLMGKEAASFIKEVHSQNRILSDQKELIGTCAVAGKVRGKVRIINSTSDLPKMRRGEILVSYVTDVNLEPAMIKAAAIVTDSGGMTSHAAIFAREFGITCVVGTKVATKVLSDGDEIEVNADMGVVSILSKRSS